MTRLRPYIPTLIAHTHIESRGAQSDAFNATLLAYGHVTVLCASFTICIYDFARGLTPNEHLLAQSEFELHMEYI